MVKAPKDPNAPKRPMSPYLSWRTANYKAIVKTMPVGYSFQELNQKMSATWKTVTEETKAPLETVFKEKMAKYNKLMSAYKHTASYKAFQKTKADFKVQKVKKTKFKKDENAPAKPLSGYFLFLADNRDKTKATMPKPVAHKDLLKKLGEVWNNTPESEKKVYRDKADAAKKVYLVKLEKYKKSDEFKAYEEEKKEWKAGQKKQLKAATKRASRGEEEKQTEDAPKPKKAKKATKSKKSTKKPKAPKARKAVRKASRKARKASKKSTKKGKKSAK